MLLSSAVGRSTFRSTASDANADRLMVDQQGKAGLIGTVTLRSPRSGGRVLGALGDGLGPPMRMLQITIL
jgi:hypothetical protein